MLVCIEMSVKRTDKTILLWIYNCNLFSMTQPIDMWLWFKCFIFHFTLPECPTELRGFRRNAELHLFLPSFNPKRDNRRMGRVRSSHLMKNSQFYRKLLYVWPQCSVLSYPVPHDRKMPSLSLHCYFNNRWNQMSLLLTKWPTMEENLPMHLWRGSIM